MKIVYKITQIRKRHQDEIKYKGIRTQQKKGVGGKKVEDQGRGVRSKKHNKTEIKDKKERVKVRKSEKRKE